MKILDFFCAEKPCSPEFEDLKKTYFQEIRSSFTSCTDCDLLKFQKKYLKILYYAKKKVLN